MRIGILAAILMLGPASGLAEGPSPVHILAPTGRLRVAINLGNPVLAQQPPGAAGPRGVSVALARELGRRLGLPVDLVTYDAAGKVTDARARDAWDLAFLAIDPVRADVIAFTHPYVVIEGAYLVPGASPARTVEEIDRPCVRVAVGRGSAYDLFLARELKQARRIVAPSSAEALDLFLGEKLEAAAGVRQPLEAFARAHPGTRVLPGKFMSIRQALAVPRGREACLAYLNAFLEEMKATGFVARELAGSGQADAAVAPAQGL